MSAQRLAAVTVSLASTAQLTVALNQLASESGTSRKISLQESSRQGTCVYVVNKDEKPQIHKLS